MYKIIDSLEINLEPNLEPESYPMAKRIHAEILASEELANDVELLRGFLFTWTGPFLHGVYHSFKNVKRFDSILFCLLQSQSYQLEWVKFSIFSGQYDIAMRELRSFIENAFYHFRYDHNSEYQNMTVEQKYDEMTNDAEKDKGKGKRKGKKSHGREVFQNSGYQDWESIYQDVYQELCSYVHTSIGRKNALQINRDGFNALLDPVFDIDRIRECIEMFKKVVKLEVRLMEIILKDVYKVSDVNYVSLFN